MAVTATFAYKKNKKKDGAEGGKEEGFSSTWRWGSSGSASLISIYHIYDI